MKTPIVYHLCLKCKKNVLHQMLHCEQDKNDNKIIRTKLKCMECSKMPFISIEIKEWTKHHIEWKEAGNELT